MAGTFDLAAAIAERETKTPPWEMEMGGHTFILSSTVSDRALESLKQERPLTSFFKEQMSADDFEMWETLDLELDQLIQGQLLFHYFDHIGYDNPFQRDGRPNRSGLGEGAASNRSSRRAAQR